MEANHRPKRSCRQFGVHGGYTPKLNLVLIPLSKSNYVMDRVEAFLSIEPSVALQNRIKFVAHFDQGRVEPPAQTTLHRAACAEEKSFTVGHHFLQNSIYS